MILFENVMISIVTTPKTECHAVLSSRPAVSRLNHRLAASPCRGGQIHGLECALDSAMEVKQ